MTIQAEPVRYALLRRLAPSIRHHLVMNLQPIGMIYEVMERRLRAPQPDFANLHDSAQKINRFARAALDSSVDVVTWLAPDEAAVVTAYEGVRESVSLLATSLSFRGYTVRNEVAVPTGNVPASLQAVQRPAIRNVLTAMLLYATDETLPPAELVLGAQARAERGRDSRPAPPALRAVRRPGRDPPRTKHRPAPAWIRRA